MNWAVVYRDRPYQGTNRLPEVMHHVTVHGSDRTLCGTPCTWEHWQELPDVHPEDVSAIERCDRCYRVLEIKREKERAGQQVWGQRSLAEAMRLS